MPDLIVLATFAAISLLTAALALLVTSRWGEMRYPRRPVAQAPVVADAARRYEFREGYLLSTHDPNDAFLPPDTDRSSAFEVLSRALEPLNDRFQPALAALIDRGEAFFLSGQIGPDTLSLTGRVDGDKMILTVGPGGDVAGRQLVEAEALAAMQAEANDMRDALDQGRTIAWKTNTNGEITWANASYFLLLDRLGQMGEEAPWPLPKVFETQLDPPPIDGNLRRCQIHLDDDRDALWFEVTALPQRDGAHLWSALPVDRLVKAEAALREFVQTLSKTFAHLPIGLAVFDKRRELMLFNPALVTLSTLGAEFLSSRPSLVSFLDALRDHQRMPEPKDYKSWRDEIAKLEQGAEDGSYQELWTLPGGQSFRVMGRPHPDGAVAFMFEDISTEVSLTRQFRGDLDLYHSVLDDTPGALAVFSSTGQLLLSNAGYAELWGEDPRGTLGDLSLIDATRQWQALCQPTGLWGDIRQFGSRMTERTVWAEEVSLRDGRSLMVRVSPLAAGAMAVRFLSTDHVDAEGLITTFKTPPRRSPLYEAAEAPARFLTRRSPAE